MLEWFGLDKEMSEFDDSLTFDASIFGLAVRRHLISLKLSIFLGMCAFHEGKCDTEGCKGLTGVYWWTFEPVHADHVPLDGISFGGSKYVLIIVDDYTRYAWVYFSQSKDAATVTPLIQAFIALILTQFGIIIQRWRTDGGTGEFVNSLIASVYRAYGMIHQPSTPHVKQQNGVIERRVQTLKNMERSMRAGAGVLDDYRFQAESLATAVLLTNIQPSSTLDDYSPHLLLFNKQPPLDFLKPWGCLAYVNLRKEQRTGAETGDASGLCYRLHVGLQVSRCHDSKNI